MVSWHSVGWSVATMVTYHSKLDILLSVPFGHNPWDLEDDVLTVVFLGIVITALIFSLNSAFVIVDFTQLYFQVLVLLILKLFIRKFQLKCIVATRCVLDTFICWQ
jgi:hypothetical protein